MRLFITLTSLVVLVGITECAKPERKYEFNPNKIDHFHEINPCPQGTSYEIKSFCGCNYGWTFNGWNCTKRINGGPKGDKNMLVPIGLPVNFKNIESIAVWNMATLKKDGKWIPTNITSESLREYFQHKSKATVEEDLKGLLLRLKLKSQSSKVDVKIIGQGIAPVTERRLEKLLEKIITSTTTKRPTTTTIRTSTQSTTLRTAPTTSNFYNKKPTFYYIKTTTAHTTKKPTKASPKPTTDTTTTRKKTTTTRGRTQKPSTTVPKTIAPTRKPDSTKTINNKTTNNGTAKGEQDKIAFGDENDGQLTGILIGIISVVVALVLIIVSLIIIRKRKQAKSAKPCDIMRIPEEPPYSLPTISNTPILSHTSLRRSPSPYATSEASYQSDKFHGFSENSFDYSHSNYLNPYGPNQTEPVYKELEIENIYASAEDLNIIQTPKEESLYRELEADDVDLQAMSSSYSVPDCSFMTDQIDLDEMYAKVQK